jgi:hypothetical protein
MSEQQVPEFEDRLRTLLERAAEAIPPDIDISTRVRQVVARGTSGPAGGGVGPRALLATVAAALVVALLAGVLAFARPNQPLRPTGTVTHASSGTATAPLPVVVPSTSCQPMFMGNPFPFTGTPVPTPVGTPVDDSSGIGRQSSLHGITITIDRAYADATQTVITYHMQTNLNPPLPVQPVLIDGQGHRYGVIGGVWDIQLGGYYVFSPLPQDELGAPQTLTFITQQMQLADPSEAEAHSTTQVGAKVDGPWQIGFSLIPTVGPSVTLSNPLLTRNGVTVTPLRLDLAPAGGGLDGVSGGARVVVRLSGLAPGMHIDDATSFKAVLNLSGFSSSSGCRGGVLELVLPSGQQIMPGDVTALGQLVPITPAEQTSSFDQTVGPSGTVDLEALFFTPIPPGTSIILYLDHVTAQLMGMAKPTQISGPWEFRLSPSA